MDEKYLFESCLESAREGQMSAVQDQGGIQPQHRSGAQRLKVDHGGLHLKSLSFTCTCLLLRIFIFSYPHTMLAVLVRLLYTVRDLAGSLNCNYPDWMHDKHLGSDKVMTCP